MPESTRLALQRLQEQGIIITLCTGRSEYEMASLREELGIDWAITCNGTHIGYRGETVFGSAFTKDTVREWLEQADRLNQTLLLYGSEKMFTNRQDAPYFLQAQQEIGFMNQSCWKLIRMCLIFINALYFVTSRMSPSMWVKNVTPIICTAGVPGHSTLIQVA